MTLQQGDGQPGSFEERLAAARAKHGRVAQPRPAAPLGSGGMPISALGIGLRVGIELVSALLVGVGIGWALDRWLHTMPLFLAVFVLLGGAAGVLNVWRMMGGKAGRISRSG